MWKGGFLRCAIFLELLEEERLLLNGRQLYWLILREIARTPAEDSITQFADLQALRLQGDNLRRFQTEWKKTLYGMLKRPDDEILESLYDTQVRASRQFEGTYALYEMKQVQEGAEKSYQMLFMMVERFLDGRKRQANRERGQPRDSHALAAPSGAKPTPKAGSCKQHFYKGVCSRTDCPLTHFETIAEGGGKKKKGKGKGKGGKDDKGKGNGKDKGKGKGDKKGKGKGKGDKKGKGKGKGDKKGKDQPANSPPERGRSKERTQITQRQRGPSPAGDKDAPACKWHVNGNCTKGANCRNWHADVCKFWMQGSCSLGDNCVYPHWEGAKAKPKGKAKADPKEKAKAKAKGKRGRGKGGGKAATATDAQGGQ